MKKLTCILFFLLPMVLHAQHTNVDSLVKVLNTQKLKPEEQLNMLKKICAAYKEVNVDSLSKYANQGMQLAEKENNEAVLAPFYRYVGISCFQKEEFDKSSSYLDKALKLAQKREDKEEEAAAYLATGYMYSCQSNIKMMIEYQFKALSMYEALGDKDRIMESLMSIGDGYRRANNSELSIKYLNRAKDMAGESNNFFLKALLYYELEQTVSDVKDKINYGLKVIEYARSANDKLIEYLGNYSLTTIYLYDLEDYDKALVYAKESYRIAKERGATSYIYDTLIILSDIYLNQENYKTSETTALEAWSMDSTNLTGARSVAWNLGIANIYLGNKDKSTEFLVKYRNLTSQYTKQSYHKEMVEMETKYETQKKEMRIASLEKERQLYSLLGITGALLAVSLGIVLWQKNRNAQKEKQLIAAQSIQDGELNERARLAEDLHDRLGGSLSAVKIELQNAENLQNVGDKLDQCIKEVREITHNLMPRSLRLSGLKGALEDFTVQFPNVHFHFFGEEKRVKERLEFALYCCANELITNSLRHSGAESINVQLIQSEKFLSLTVQDDGCGFDETTVKKGIGLKNIQDRIASYNGKLDIASAPGKGTETVIELRVMS